jgi:hypothetical protein
MRVRGGGSQDYKKVTAEDILAHADNDGITKLTVDDIIVDVRNRPSNLFFLCLLPDEWRA